MLKVESGVQRVGRVAQGSALSPRAQANELRKGGLKMDGTASGCDVPLQRGCGEKAWINGRRNDKWLWPLAAERMRRERIDQLADGPAFLSISFAAHSHALSARARYPSFTSHSHAPPAVECYPSFSTHSLLPLWHLIRSAAGSHSHV